jgi:hypothetical protein
MVEAELDRMIERRARNGEQDPDEREDLWVDSVRRFHASSEAEMRHRWIEYHRHLQVLHQSLADEHEAEAEKLEEPGEGEGAIADG